LKFRDLSGVEIEDQTHVFVGKELKEDNTKLNDLGISLASTVLHFLVKYLQIFILFTFILYIRIE
jgi:hypothetical protein